MENFETITNKEVVNGFINSEIVEFENKFDKNDEITAYADLYDVFFD